MIGILCSRHKEKGLAQQFYTLSKKFGKKSDDLIIVFTISNIDLMKNTVKGSLISNGKIEFTEVPVPKVIFNMALQREKNEIKKQRLLASSDNVKLINDTIRFDQWMIMEMLSPSASANEFLLPYHIYDKKTRNFKPDEDKRYIAMPARGSSLSRIIYTEPAPEADGDKLVGTQYFKKGHVCDYIDASLCQKRWIFLDLPDILTYNNHPVIYRSYMQKSYGGKWMVIGENIFPGKKFFTSAEFERINNAALTITNQISHFMPSIGHCFIDFIIGTNGAPYFLHLGGFNHDILYQRQSEFFFKTFYENIIHLAEYYGSMY